jgi:hypothetical protein
MRVSTLKYAALSWVSSLSMIIILVMPFHALVTVWGASLIGHYTVLRLWKEVLLLICALATLFLLAYDHKIRSHTLSRRLVWLILAYIALNFLCGAVALHRGTVGPKALGYGLIINTRFLIFFLLTWSAAVRMNRLRVHWQWIVLWPAGIVIAIGLLQAFVLPHDFLRHFGYGISTIEPFETINHNQHYIRVMSTLRGANPLGAYLLVPISLLSILLVKRRRPRIYGPMLAGALIVEFFSFSRSAWLGALVAIALVLMLSLRSKKARQLVLLGAAAVLLILGSLAVVFHHSARFENFVLHTQTHSAVKATSNQGHFDALRSGARDVVHHQLGNGPGSAGPASVYNSQCPARISENYFLQIGQELGWLGLTLFVLINIGVGYLLWLRRDHPLALALFASFVGLTIINMLSHAWADDTIAYIWWGLAGIALAPGLNKEE